MFSSESYTTEVFTSETLFDTLPKKNRMSSGQDAVPECITNGSFVTSSPREDSSASAEVFTNGSFVESLPIGEDEVVLEEVFTNGSLPKSLTSAPLLPLYQFVVTIFCGHIHISQINFPHIFF